MEPLYRILADVVVVLHASYVAFVVLGELVILLGIALRWEWIRNRTFRLAHLAAILIVVVEAWSGITCPLTNWENSLRSQAGQTVEQGDFIGRWVHHALFYQAAPWVFTAIYSAFGALVILSLVLSPPRWRSARTLDAKRE
jgi:4-amino-4-deoxy-L-arabinose transferase-like glycosyltransferase